MPPFLIEFDFIFFSSFSFFTSSFFTYSFFVTLELLKLTPDLGGILWFEWFTLLLWWLGMLWLGLFLFFPRSSFLIFLAELIFWICSLDNYLFISTYSTFFLFSSTILLYISFSYELSFNRSAYLKVFKLWSAEEFPGDMQAIITTFDLSILETKESLRISVNFEARKGTWSSFSSIALMHSLRANKLFHFIFLPFIDFSSFDSSLSVVTLSILSSLAACQIN